MLSLIPHVALASLLGLATVGDWFHTLAPLLQDYAIYLVPVLWAAFSTEIGEVLQRWNTWLDNRGPKLKRILVATLAFAGMKLTALVGVPVSHTGEFVAAGLAFLFHLQDRRRAVR